MENTVLKSISRHTSNYGSNPVIRERMVKPLWRTEEPTAPPKPFGNERDQTERFNQR
jgi:hypothetical protein